MLKKKFKQTPEGKEEYNKYEYLAELLDLVEKIAEKLNVA